MTTFDVLRSVAAHGVDGNDRGPISVLASEVATLLAGATAHKLVGLLDQAVADGAVECDEPTAAQIGTLATEVAVWSVRLERHLLAVHDLFSERGVPHRFVKGSTIAHRFYSHPGLRMSVDVDVLVPGGKLERSLDVLAAGGHVRLQPDPYPGFSRRYAKSVTVRHDTGVEVDVHRVIPDGPFGLRARSDGLWERPTEWMSLGGREVPTLDPVAAFVQACVNAVASYDMVTLASLRDVAQVGTAVADRIPEVHELAGALAVRACLAQAVGHTTKEMGWDAPSSVAEIAAWPVSDRERQWLDSYRDRPSDRRRAFLGCQAVPGVVPKVVYLGSTARLLAGRPARRRARAANPARWSRG